MSSSEVTVKLTCPSIAAELLIVNGEFRVVSRGAAPLEAPLERGIYSLKAKLGDAVTERIEVLRPRAQPYEFELKSPEFASAVPIDNTSTHHEYQGTSPTQFTGTTAQTIQLGTACAFVIYVRDATGRSRTLNAAEKSAYSANFDGFRLLSPDRSVLVDFDTAAIKDIDAGYMGAQVRLDTGAYSLMWQRGDEYLCLPVQTVPGFAVQIYLSLQPLAADTLEMRPDFREVSYVYDFMNAQYAPGRQDLKDLESVRLALEHGRNVVQASVLRDMLAGKFENPMLGLYAAHVLLIDEKPDLELLGLVIKNTAEMLRPEFPDVVALAWHYEQLAKKRPEGYPDRAWADLLKELKGPPLLVRSWEMLLKCADAEVPRRIGGLDVFRVAGDVVPAGIHMVWQSRVPRKPVKDAAPVVEPAPLPSSWLGAARRQILNAGGTAADYARDAIGSIALTILPRPFAYAIDTSTIEASDITSTDDAWRVMSRLAHKHRWADAIKRLNAGDGELAQLTVLQRNLVGILLQLGAADRGTRRELGPEFVDALLRSNRVPLETLAQSLAGLDKTMTGVSASD